VSNIPWCWLTAFEQRKGDQPRVDYDMRKQEEAETAEPDMVELERLKEVVLDRVWGTHRPPPFGPRGSMVSGRQL
jgi:hypothetical protein